MHIYYGTIIELLYVAEKLNHIIMIQLIKHTFFFLFTIKFKTK